MSTKNFDVTDTTNWQQIEGNVFLLERSRGRFNANAFEVRITKYSKTNPTSKEEIASKICDFLNNEYVAVDKNKKLEEIFRNIVKTCQYAVGDNIAFHPGYGFENLNRLRIHLGLKPINTGNYDEDIKEMKRLVDG